jgi:hypothetical protein
VLNKKDSNMGSVSFITILIVVLALSQAGSIPERPTTVLWDVTLSRADIFRLLPSTLDNVIGPLNDNETVYYYNPGAPLARLEGITFTPPLYGWGPQRSLSFLEVEPRQSYYCSVPLETLNEALVDSLRGLPERVDQAQTKGGLWLSSPGVTAAMHFDASDNWLSQLEGEKHVWLVNPRAWRLLHLYSALHPLARQSQAPFEGGPVALLGAANGTFRDALAVGIEEVVLQAGQSLFIPAFHFHLISVPKQGGPSISINTYLDAPHKAILGALHRRPPLSSKAILFDALTSVFNSLDMDLADLGRAVLDTRWQHFALDPFLDGDFNSSFRMNTLGADNSLSCRDLRIDGTVDESYADAAKQEAAVLLPSFLELRSLLPDAFELICADFLEATTARSLGTENVWRFLSCVAVS